MTVGEIVASKAAAGAAMDDEEGLTGKLGATAAIAALAVRCASATCCASTMEGVAHARGICACESAGPTPAAATEEIAFAAADGRDSLPSTNPPDEEEPGIAGVSSPVPGVSITIPGIVADAMSPIMCFWAMCFRSERRHL